MAIFFQKGKVTLAYKLKGILNDTCNVVRSISHTIWSVDDFGFSMTDSMFSVATFEFNQFEFELFEIYPRAAAILSHSI